MVKSKTANGIAFALPRTNSTHDGASCKSVLLPGVTSRGKGNRPGGLPVRRTEPAPSPGQGPSFTEKQGPLQARGNLV